MGNKVSVIIPSRMLEIDHLNRRVLRRIFGKVQIDPVSGCWNWTGSLDPHYGLTWYRGRHEKAHRFMYAWLIEPIPMGCDARRFAQLDHVICKNKRCCNPLHLELVTQQQNVLRGISPPAINARKTHCKNGHDLSQQRVNESGSRTCRECDNQRRRDETPKQRERRRQVLHDNFVKRYYGSRRKELLQAGRESQRRLPRTETGGG